MTALKKNLATVLFPTQHKYMLHGSFQEFLITYGDSTKIVKVNPESCDDLQEEIRRRFKIADDQSIIMQTFVKKYNEYVDVEPGTELCDGDKILLKRVR